MSITKIAKAGMEVTANYQKLSDLNVAFYNQDINTSILQFNVTRNDAVVPLGKTNVEGYIVLLHEDGSRIQDNLGIVNEEHGVIQYTIPREFLKHTGKVLGQVYIAVKGRDDTAVMRKISFDIKQDLMTGFSAAAKLEYIKTFDDLQTQIKQRVEAIEEAIANGEDYVAKMIATLDTGKKEIAATVSKANTDVNKVVTDANNSVKTTADAATTNITSTATKATTDIAKTVSDVNAKAKEVTDAIKDNQVVKITDVVDYQKKKITADDGRAKVYIDETMDVYEELPKLERGFYSIYISAGARNSPSTTVRGSVFVEDKAKWLSVQGVGSNGKIYSVHYAASVWIGWLTAASESIAQIPKITNDDGSTIAITNYDLLNTTDSSNFDGYSNTSINMPAGISQAGYIKRKYRGGLIEVTYSPYNTNAVYRNSYNSVSGGNWLGWEKLVTASELAAVKGSDTGWITYNTLNGVLANTSFTDPTENGYKCAYRKITANGVTRLLLRVNISNITAESVVFANLPNGIVINAQSGVARTNKANQKVVVVLRPSGELSINVPAGFSENSYTYNQFDWTF